jgi:hypothetical protein
MRCYLYMLETIVFALISAAYFIYTKKYGMERICLAAIAFAALYLLVYLCVPPHVPIKSTYSGQLFGLLPLVALFLILFPGVNYKMPVSLTRAFGWFILLGIGALLIGFKVFIW